MKWRDIKEIVLNMSESQLDRPAEVYNWDRMGRSSIFGGGKLVEIEGLPADQFPAGYGTRPDDFLLFVD